MDLSGSEKPVGTLEELRDNGLDPTRFGSCSPRDNKNKGCAWHNFCRFREWRDRVGGKKGPLNFVANVILSPAEGGVANNPEMPCFDYYYSGLYARQRESTRTGEVIKVIGVEGDGKKYRSRISVRAHPKPVPGCLACSEGKCIRRETKLHEAEITAFPRPGEVYTGMAEAARMRDEMMMEDESATTSAALAKSQEMISGTTPPEPIADAKKIVEAAVTPKQMLEEFGEQHYHEDANGWRVDLKDDKGRVDMKKVRKFNEMDRQRQRAEIASSERVQSKVSEVTIKGPDGKRMKVDERIAERMERKLWERRNG